MMLDEDDYYDEDEEPTIEKVTSYKPHEMIKIQNHPSNKDNNGKSRF